MMIDLIRLTITNFASSKADEVEEEFLKGAKAGYTRYGVDIGDMCENEDRRESFGEALRDELESRGYTIVDADRIDLVDFYISIE